MSSSDVITQKRGNRPRDLTWYSRALGDGQGDSENPPILSDTEQGLGDNEEGSTAPATGGPPEHPSRRPAREHAPTHSCLTIVNSYRILINSQY